MKPLASVAQPTEVLMVDPYPLILEPLLKAKVWGGRRLAAYGKDLPQDTPIGESWEVADLAETSPSGGGGGPARSVIVNGRLAGRSLQETLTMWQADLVGARWRSAPEFPLLIKLIDAAQHLSVQVHPTAAFAATHPEAHIKTESWLILEAAPGAELYLGLQPGIGASELRRAVETGRVPEVLRAVPAVAGDCHHLPSGTIHALGAGILVTEVQTPSDTTFRLYDWTAEYDRPERELHIEEALASITPHPPPPPTSAPATDGMIDLVTTDRYVLRCARGLSAMALQPETCTVVMCIDGEAAVNHRRPPLRLTKGATAVIPAATAADTTIDTSMGAVLLSELAR